MDVERFWHSLRLQFIRTQTKRAEYLRKRNVFKSMGEHCCFMPKKVPLYARLIRFGDYVVVASNVAFHTHDAVHTAIGCHNELLPESLKDIPVKEGVGCIDIGSHVYIAAGAVIEHGVRIGDNVVITTRSVVCNDIPSDCVVRGNPAKIVCPLSQYLQLRTAKKSYPDELAPKGGVISEELEEWLWTCFDESRQKK